MALRGNFSTAHIRALLLGAIVTAGMSCAATAAEPSQGNSLTLEISGFVPVACRASLVANVVTPNGNGETSLGTLSEFCNNPSGYQVLVDHSPELTNARLVVDGVEIALAQEGSTLISSSSHAARKTHSVALRGAGENVSGTLSVRIVPL
ncbi:hypothetical protein SAMN05444678_11453 [Sphingomonas sp. YR710]|uniref:hypothetical protein n=1 Tax=Sphingomonas sp. YR710 TaxID=1882773 RepID=UPI0008867DCE|nr:hypothetical protein [Sphingomonas sp. YR710]SDD49499.1 hypothetical protein SAMN05444678_11453 [Sphingomonas sp. YR710]